MKRKSVAAVALLLVLAFVLAGCNYVGRPIGAGNHAMDTSNKLSELLKQPTKTIVEQTVQNITEIEKAPTEAPPSEEPGEPEKEPITSPFQVTTDVFSKIEELLQQVSDKMVDSTSATGVSDELMIFPVRMMQ